MDVKNPEFLCDFRSERLLKENVQWKKSDSKNLYFGGIGIFWKNSFPELSFLGAFFPAVFPQIRYKG
jgi:hypothetical protein